MATTSVGTAGLVKDLVFNNFRTAIIFTGWRGEVDGCYFTDAAAVAATATLLHIGPGATNFTLRNSTVTQVTNTAAPYLIWVEEAGISGTFTIDNCVFFDIKGGSPGGRGFIGTGRSASAATVIRNSIFDTFVFTASSGTEAGMIIPFGGTFLFEGNIVRNINLNTPIVNPNRVGGTPTVRNCLFYNINNGTWGPVNSYGSLAVYNSTFHNCSAVTNAFDVRNIYNSSISNCTRVNGHATNPITELRYVNIFETPTVGPYNPDNSSNITDYDPKYVNTDTNDYRLRGNSPLVDAGNNAYVTWASPVDLNGNPRVMDGSFDGVETVDIGAYEFDLGPAVPTFSVNPFFDVFEGTTVNVPVSIVPSATGSVTANIDYEYGLSGPASLAIADGSGPQNLAVQVAAGTGTATGSAMDIAITDAASVVEPAWCTVRSFTKTVTITGTPTLFLAPYGYADLPVKLMSPNLAALTDINITVGARAGAGSNAITWAGGAKIAQGAAQSQGYLAIEANEGVNTISLTVDGGFVFTESGTATFDLQIVCLSSPIYVSGTGSDTAGIGSAGSPFRSITKALTSASAIQQIQVLPGLYNAAAGETFPLNVPAGVSIIGTAGPNRDADDSAVLTMDGTASAFTLATTPAGTLGRLQDLVISDFKANAIVMTGWRGTIENCVIQNCVAGVHPTNAAVTASVLFAGNQVIDLTLRSTVVKDIDNASLPHVIRFIGSTGTVKIQGCTFNNLVWGSQGGNRGPIAFEGSVVYNPAYPTTITDTLFENITCAVNPNSSETSLFAAYASSVTVDRCIFRNINIRMQVMGSNRSEGNFILRNSLFYDVDSNGWGTVGGFRAIANVRNCTFDNCKPVINTNNTDARVHNFYNCIISNCSTLNPGSVASNKTVRLHYTDLFNTPPGNYDTDNSTNVTTADPLYVDSGAGNFRLRRLSPNVDAGNNANVSPTTDALDLAKNTRVLDGNVDGTDTVDLGAYEYDPVPTSPTFSTEEATYQLFAGASLVVPVSIVPPAPGDVTANVNCGIDLSGSATLEIAGGAGPANLTVTAASPLTVQEGSMSVVGLAAIGVQANEFGVYLHSRTVTVGGSAKLLVGVGVEKQIKVRFPSSAVGAPAAITVTTGSVSGGGTNSITWVGGTTIPVGGSESEGYLSVTGESGRNTVTLTVDNGFSFSETGAASVTLTVIGYTSPLYVSPLGSDATGDGTLANPFGTITYAVSVLAAGEEVRVLPGTYAPSTGEVLPIQPAGVRVVGFNATAENPALLDGEAQASNFIKWRQVVDAGYISGLTFTNTKMSAIMVDASTVTVENCLFRDITATPVGSIYEGGTGSAVTLANNGTLTINTSTFTNCGGTGAIFVSSGDVNNNNKLYVNGSSFLNSTPSFAPISCPGDVVSHWFITDCVFQNNRPTSAGLQDGYAASGIYVYGPFGTNELKLQRCKFLDGYGPVVLTISRCKAEIHNCLFVNNYCSMPMLYGEDWGANVVNTTFVANSGGFTGRTPERNVELKNCIVSDNAVLTTARPEKLILKNVILWNTPAGSGYNTALSTNVYTVDPMLTSAPSYAVRTLTIGTHGDDEPNGSRILRYAGISAIDVNTTYTLAVKYLMPGGWSDGRIYASLGLPNVNIQFGGSSLGLAKFTSDMTYAMDSSAFAWAWKTNDIKTPLEMPEGGFTLMVDNYDSCLLMDKLDIRNKATGDVLWSAEAEDGVWDNTTKPLYKVGFAWYAGAADPRIAKGSPAIDAGDDTFLAPEDVTDLDGNDRILDGNGDDVPTVDLGCYEYQGAAGATVATFVVTDRTSGSTLVTNEAAVPVAITVNAPEGITVVNWQVTESDVEPTEWLAEAPTAYTIQAASGADVTLYAWIKDSADNVASKPATIYYDTRLPVVSNVVVTAGAPGSATVTWDTDIPAEGTVNYGPVSMAGTTPNTSAENALGTSHSVVITGIVDGTNYKLVLVNNEKVEPPIYWPNAWPIDGDANMDCRVNILDLIFIRNKLNLDVATGDNWKADVNKDTRINILDLIFVRNKLNTQCP